jgi:hypothetical protein
MPGEARIIKFSILINKLNPTYLISICTTKLLALINNLGLRLTLNQDAFVNYMIK